MGDYRSGQIPTTPFPNVLIDKVMPCLSDSSLRVLVVVVRQTLGFRSSDGTHKKVDWISHSQLRQKTGRSSSAISAAINSLCRKGLIKVTDRLNHELATPEARRKCRSRLYYQLNGLGQDNILASMNPLTRIRNSITTKETYTKRESVISENQDQTTLRSDIEALSGLSQSSWHRVGELIKPNL